MALLDTIRSALKLPLDFAGGLREAARGGEQLTSPRASGSAVRFQDLRARLAAQPRERVLRTMQVVLGRAIVCARKGNMALLRSLPDLAPSRSLAVWASHKAGLHDPDFQRLVAAADKARDGRRWPDAIAGYEAALRLYDRHAGYTVQLAHCRKEGGDLRVAEIAYRDAIALGALPDEVWPHLEFVVHRNGGCVQLYPATVMQALARPADAIAIDTLATSRELRSLAWLLLNDEPPAHDWVLYALRATPERDRAAAAMIADPRFLTANRSLVALCGRRRAA